MKVRPVLTLIAAISTLGVPPLATAQSRDSGVVRKSYVIPALEIVGFQSLLNIFDRAVLGADYRSTFKTIRRNLRGPWVVDSDPYTINQFGHPTKGRYIMDSPDRQE